MEIETKMVPVAKEMTPVCRTPLSVITESDSHKVLLLAVLKDLQ